MKTGPHTLSVSALSSKLTMVMSMPITGRNITLTINARTKYRSMLLLQLLIPID